MVTKNRTRSSFLVLFAALALGATTPAMAQLSANKPISLSIATYLSVSIYNGATLAGTTSGTSVPASVGIIRTGSDAAVNPNTWSDQHIVVSSNASYTLTGTPSAIVHSTGKSITAFVKFGSTLTGGTDAASPMGAVKTGPTPKTWYIRLYPNTGQSIKNANPDESGTYTGTVTITFSTP